MGKISCLEFIFVMLLSLEFANSGVVFDLILENGFPNLFGQEYDLRIDNTSISPKVNEKYPDLKLLVFNMSLTDVILTADTKKVQAKPKVFSIDLENPTGPFIFYPVISWMIPHSEKKISELLSSTPVVPLLNWMEDGIQKLK